ncbi:AAA family ATPase [Lysobacter capsici]|uniref:AAA family ATPase n=1 Tax=Lysobacter capsici TaxID=435897 RepID=UPI0009EBB6DB|nr:ATP-binding protein [Lysobacter capsici]
MASAEQLKALLRSHGEGDDEHFYSVAMQVAAHEARLGHGALAEELRNLIDSAKRRRGVGGPVPIGKPRGELASLLAASWPKLRINDMVLDETTTIQIQRIIKEQKHAERILGYGLAPRRKLLLVGAPGTGKTMTAAVLAGELGLPLFSVRLDGLLTKFMGEAAAKLRQIFDATTQSRGVYFFDEFDAIGSQRRMANDVGEISRILNSFLQMIEQDASHSLVVAATNHPEVLDAALLRRFDDVLKYEVPTEVQIICLLKAKLSGFLGGRVAWKRLADQAKGLSHAEIKRAAEEAIKDALIHDRNKVTENEVGKMLKERVEAAARIGGRR